MTDCTRLQLKHTATQCNNMQFTTSPLQHTATHRNTLQHTTTHTRTTSPPRPEPFPPPHGPAIWIKHIARIDESCRTYRWVMSHIWMSHIAHMDESCRTYGWVMSHIWMRWSTRRHGMVWMHSHAHPYQAMPSYRLTAYEIHIWHD